jgi:tRNA-specific 2-thiouridylase
VIPLFYIFVWIMIGKTKKRIVVAMSGGVDSSVAAALLKKHGHDVIGMTMKIGDPSSCSKNSDNACSRDYIHETRRVAETLGIPLFVVDFERDFQHQIIDRFCEEYFAGRTPNPCVLCNQVLKFDLLLRKSREVKADFLATGHYARMVQQEGQFSLRKGLDRCKDQSYFLFTLTQEQMSRICFPLGEMTKQEVYAHAERFGLKLKGKPESQDICFIPDGNYVRFLEDQRGAGRMDGEIVHVSGQVLGRHRGTYRYTVGQRKGLGIGWRKPLYVVKIDAGAKRVIVGEEEHLVASEVAVQGTNWIIPEPFQIFRCRCRIRYRQSESPASLTPLPGRRAVVRFDEPQRGVTPGQAIVFYDGERVLGGGWIE